MAIQSFKDAGTEDLFHGVKSARARRIPADIQWRALRKLDSLNAAHTLEDLTSPPSNHLEALVGDLRGYHSIRITGQWRLVFKWTGNDATDVHIVDYH